MRQWRWASVCAPLLASLSLPAAAGRPSQLPQAPETIVNPAISFAPGYSLPSSFWAYPNTIQAPEFPDIGDQLLILGQVAAFQAPFEDLDAADPAMEFTYRMRDLTVVRAVLWDDFIHNEGGIGVEHAGGVLEIYRDTSPDADFSDPSTFADGELILSASISQLWLILYSSQIPPQMGSLQFTGGTLFDRVSESGVGFGATNQGTFAMHPDAIPDNLEALGFNGMSETTIAINSGVPLRSTTWGDIKALYAEPVLR